MEKLTGDDGLTFAELGEKFQYYDNHAEKGKAKGGTKEKAGTKTPQSKGKPEVDSRSSEWVVDSGCTIHMTNDKEKLDDVYVKTTSVATALNEVDSGRKYHGTVHLNCLSNDEIQRVNIKDVVCIEKSRKNLK